MERLDAVGPSDSDCGFGIVKVDGGVNLNPMGPPGSNPKMNRIDSTSEPGLSLLRFTMIQGLKIPLPALYSPPLRDSPRSRFTEHIVIDRHRPPAAAATSF